MPPQHRVEHRCAVRALRTCARQALFLEAQAADPETELGEPSRPAAGRPSATASIAAATGNATGHCTPSCSPLSHDPRTKAYADHRTNGGVRRRPMLPSIASEQAPSSNRLTEIEASW